MRQVRGWICEQHGKCREASRSHYGQQRPCAHDTLSPPPPTHLAALPRAGCLEQRLHLVHAQVQHITRLEGGAPEAACTHGARGWDAVVCEPTAKVPANEACCLGFITATVALVKHACAQLD